jgi:hypothetical protein
LGFYLIMSGGNFIAVWDGTLLIAVMIVGGAFLGSMLKPGNTVPA